MGAHGLGTPRLSDIERATLALLSLAVKLVCIVQRGGIRPARMAKRQGLRRSCLAPTLKTGDTVIMNSASVHMVESVREATQAKGAILFYLTEYSPDLAPIEQPFAKLKSTPRKIATNPLKQVAYTIDSYHRHRVVSDCTHPIRVRCISGQLRICSMLSETL